ncbi:MAG: HD-GYP domain-containing protein [Anaerolineales bacterium]|nr:MAG: HD-GYP domain-containing protein [Anaerolineales bacterium]
MGNLSRRFSGLLTYRNPFLGIFLPLLLYIILRYLIPQHDLHLQHPAEHFQIVSATSLFSLLIAIVVGVIGIRQRNLQVLYVSLAFISLAGLFSVHGLATPGFLLGPNALVGVAVQLALLTTSFWLLISALPTTHRINSLLGRRPSLLLTAYVLALLAFGLYALRQPDIVNWIPVNQNPLRYFATAVTLFMASIAFWRYWRSYRYTSFPFQLAVTYTAGWIAVSQLIVITGQTFYLSWWIYHFLLLGCVLVCIIGLARQYRRPGTPMLALQGLFSANPEEQIQAGIGEPVRNLVRATEIRDPYTAGHQHRVAHGALRLGQALALRPEQLRALVQGGEMHDVGKLQVSREILNKTGPLTPEERKAIEAHTTAGYEMCAGLGLMGDELAIVRWHHERMDGTGYPDRLPGEQIPLLARIMAVSDVFDALTSSRAYRHAWSVDEALSYMQQNSGTQFDPQLVTVWLQLVHDGQIRLMHS